MDGAGGSDAELLSRTLQFEHKLFYFDLKENPRGQYLKISEKTSATRCTIIVPADGIAWFLELFDYYANTDEQDAVNKQLKLETKVGAFADLFLVLWSWFYCGVLIMGAFFLGVLFRYWRE